MGNRRKSWHSALKEGLQTLTFFSAFVLIVILIYNLMYGYSVVEYFYLVGPVFVIGALFTGRHTIAQAKLVIRTIKAKLKRREARRY